MQAARADRVFYCALAALSVLFLAAQQHAAGFRRHYPPVNEITAAPDAAMETLGFVSFGLRRLGSDISFIRLMQYYGTKEGVSGEMAEYAMYGLAERQVSLYDKGSYPQLYDRARRVLFLDPYNKFAALYASCSLAFNLDRPDEALRLLFFARRYMPLDTGYNACIAAIGFSKARNPQQAADLLDGAVNDPDCPSMVKQLAAFLNKRIKRYSRAYAIYQDLYLTSKDAGYVKNSREQMIRLLPVLKKEGLPVPPPAR
ncbi:MAG: hypothetical protein PHW69_09745 [Elusimicrobiaceae bacterium]|nr:hypothetical protein [Elusimicrobiaceae bacterium]